MTPNDLDRAKLIKYLWVFVLLFSIFIFYSLFRSFSFHLVSTTPSLGSIGVVTPDITFNYNRSLNNKGLVVTSDQNIVSTFSITDKKLVVSLNSATISLGKTYTITVGPVSDSSGKSIGKKTYSFTTKNIAFTSLSKEQQSTVMKQQATVPYSRTSIGYTGADALVNVGLSSSQLLDMQQGFFLYSKSVNKEFLGVVIQTNSIVSGPYDSSLPNPVSSLMFGVVIDGANYNAKLVYSGLSSAELYIYEQATGKQLFDSGTLSPSDF